MITLRFVTLLVLYCWCCCINAFNFELDKEGVTASVTGIGRNEYPTPDSLLSTLVIPGRLGNKYYDRLSNDYCSLAIEELVSFSEKGVSDVVQMSKDLIDSYRKLYDDSSTTKEQLDSSLDSCKLYLKTLSDVNYLMSGRNNGGYVMKNYIECKGGGQVVFEECNKNGTIRDTSLCAYSIYSKEYTCLGLDQIAERLGEKWSRLRCDDSGIHLSVYPDEGYMVNSVLYNNKPYEIRNKTIIVYPNYEQHIYIEFVPDVSSDISTPEYAIKDCNTYYNISGQLVNGKPTSPGIYFFNGRKMLVH